MELTSSKRIGFTPVIDSVDRSSQWVPALPAHRMGSWTWTPSTKQVFWSAELFGLLGYEAGVDVASLELFLAAIHPDDRPKFGAEQVQFLDGVQYPLEVRLLRANGSIREVFLDFTSVHDIASNQKRVIGTVLDLTDMRIAERNAARTLNFLTESQRIAQVGSWYWDPSTDQFQWTTSLYHILGIPQDKSGSDAVFLDAVHITDREIVLASRREAILHGGTSPVEFRVVRPSGETRFVQMQYRRMEASFESHPVFLGTLIDITDRHHLEASLRQSRKMEAIGRLAGGVAHDFNNLLTIILGCTELLQDQSADPRLQQIVHAAEMGSALTHKLLAFSRQSVIKPEVLELNESVQEMAKVIERLLGEDIQLVLDLSDDLPPILADRHQIEQILLNLAVNSRDAMPSGGRLEIVTHPITTLDAVCEVRLTVRDTGLGMTEEVRTRIFEPFFTTKEAGKGSGLGLSTVFGIVTQANGRIEVESEPGKGAAFHLVFPGLKLARKIAESKSIRPREGHECILVVEDNERLRELETAFLEGNGYQVMAFGRPSEALEWFTSHSNEVDLLVTDILMPEKNGRRMAEEMQLQKPGLNVLFVSGYSGGLEENLRASDGYLQKPFRKQELLNAVAGVFSKGTH
jgi:two-component system, cell cycle sensor histidine kinase and response regulator CckA